MVTSDRIAVMDRGTIVYACERTDVDGLRSTVIREYLYLHILSGGN